MGNKLVIPVFTALVVVLMMIVQSLTPEVEVAEAPAVSLSEMPGFSSEVLEASEAELTILPKDTAIEKRRYVSSSGDWFQVSLVVGGRTKSSIHRPELCLPAQGYRMENPRTLAVDGIEWRAITLSSRETPPVGYAYTFFNQNGFRTASHTARIVRDIVDRSVFNRIDRWVMVTVSSSCSEDGQLKAFLAKLEQVVK